VACRANACVVWRTASNHPGWRYRQVWCSTAPGRLLLVVGWGRGGGSHRLWKRCWLLWDGGSKTSS